MNELISLLKSKNRCLRKLLQYSEHFLTEASNSADEKNLELVLELEKKRDIAIRTLDLIERKINEVAGAIPKIERTPVRLGQVDALVQEAVETVHEIVITDGLVLRKVEAIQNEVSKNLLHSKRQQDTIGKFKSSWLSESGSELDKKL